METRVKWHTIFVTALFLGSSSYALAATGNSDDEETAEESQSKDGDADTSENDTQTQTAVSQQDTEEAKKKAEEAAKKKEEKEDAKAAVAPTTGAVATGSSSTSDNSASSANTTTSQAPAGITASLNAAGNKPWVLSVRLEHDVGTGTFLRDATMRERNDQVIQSWNFAGIYNFHVKGHRIITSLRAGFDLELTVPNTNPGRRISPQSVSLSVADWGLYTEKHTDITFYGSANLFLPTTYEDRASKRYFSTRATLGLMRSFGPVTFYYSFGSTAGVYGSNVGVQRANLARSTDSIRTQLNNGVYEMANGIGVTQFDLRNSFNLMYSILPNLWLTYGVTVINAFRHGVVSQRDAATSQFADAGMGRADTLSPGLDLSWQLRDVLKNVADVPVNLMLSLGISASHPAQTSDNKGYLWPIFYQAFATNRAANNYGQVYFSAMANY